MRTNGWRCLPDGRLAFLVWGPDGPWLRYIAGDRAEAELLEVEDTYACALLAEGICAPESPRLSDAAARALRYAGRLPVHASENLTFEGAPDL